MTLLPNDLKTYMWAQNERGFVGGDVVEWLSWVIENGHHAIDALPEAPAAETGPEKWRRFMREGLDLEHRYIAWRQTASSMERRLASVSCLEDLAEGYGRLVEASASVLLARGHRDFDDRARLYLNRAYAFDHRKAVLKRAGWRTHADFRGYRSSLIIETFDHNNKTFDEKAVEALNKIYDLGEYLPPKFRLDMPNAKRHIRKARTRRRRALVKAVGFATRLVGSERAREFVRGGKFCINGRLANYELTSNGDLGKDHGGAKFIVRAKDDDAELCHLCIYTPGVPLLDHVASMVMHVQAGEEEELLTIGNAYNIKPEAEKHDWLKPFLGRREETYDQAMMGAMQDRSKFVLGRLYTSRFLGLCPRLNNRPTVPLATMESAEDRQRLLHLSRQIARALWDEMGDAFPEMNYIRHVLLTGRLPESPSYDWVNHPSVSVPVSEDAILGAEEPVIEQEVEPLRSAA